MSDRLPVPRETAPTLFDVRAELPVTQDFEAFWTLYPHKVAKDGFGRSESAYKSWNRARKHADAVTIIQGLRIWIAYWQRKNTEMEFIPHPATWLNQRRWEHPPRPQDIAGPVTRALMAARERDRHDA